VAYNGRANWPGQLCAARAGRGREKERLGRGPGQARARAAEKERHQSARQPTIHVLRSLHDRQISLRRCQQLTALSISTALYGVV